MLAAPVRGEAAVLAGPESLDASALRVLVRALEELDALGERPGGAELIALLAELPVPAGGAPYPGVVLLADPLAIRARRFRVVFVCGLCEGEFPLVSGPEPFLSDERRLELAAASGLRLAAREDSLARERYLLYACVSRATERVVLSYRSSDEEGNLALPSPFIADVADLFVPEWRQRRRTRLLADVVWPAEAAPTERERLRAEAAAAAPAGGSDEDPARWSLSAEALGLVRHREIVSRGALESFADCPVKWLVDRELQPARLEPEPEALARGSFMHDVLERLLRSLGGPVTPASLPRALELLDELLANVPATIAAGRPAAVRAAAVRRSRPTCAGTSSGRRGTAPAGGRRGSSCGSGSGGRVRVRATILTRCRHSSWLPGSWPRPDRPCRHRRRRSRDRDRLQEPRTRRASTGALETDHQLQVALYMLAVKRLLGLDPGGGLLPAARRREARRTGGVRQRRRRRRRRRPDRRAHRGGAVAGARATRPLAPWRSPSGCGPAS